MSTDGLVEATKEAVAALTEVGAILRENDDDLNGREMMAMFILMKAFQFVINPMQDEDDNNADDNPFKYDDDHTFT